MDVVAAVDHERAKRAALRGERSDDDGVERRRNGGTAGADGVRGRARSARPRRLPSPLSERRCSPPIATRSARGAEAGGPARDDDVVEGDDACCCGSSCMVATSAVRASTVASPRAIVSSAAGEVGAVDVGEEADRAEVDAEDGGVIGHRELQGAEDRAVAAECDDEFARRVTSASARARAEVDRRRGRGRAPRRRSGAAAASQSPDGVMSTPTGPRRRRSPGGTAPRRVSRSARSVHGSKRSIGMTRMRGSATVNAPTSSSRSKSSSPSAVEVGEHARESSRKPMTPTRRPGACEQRGDCGREVAVVAGEQDVAVAALDERLERAQDRDVDDLHVRRAAEQDRAEVERAERLDERHRDLARGVEEEQRADRLVPDGAGVLADAVPARALLGRRAAAQEAAAQRGVDVLAVDEEDRLALAPVRPWPERRRRHGARRSGAVLTEKTAPAGSAMTASREMRGVERAGDHGAAELRRARRRWRRRRRPRS